MKETQSVELLAPVGSFEHLVAAVENGCDAVYLGGSKFNARQSAENFDDTKMQEAIDFAHIRGVKVYITLNTLFKEKELNSVLDYVNQLYMWGADALIVQDLGIAHEIKKHFPDIELHGSTQMTIHNLDGVRQLEDLGFSRVVLARELNLTEIVNIIDNSSIDVECFVHGALCICYSGQCLMSSMIGGRSGNRGRCAQPCRLPYSLVLDHETPVEDMFLESHLLSPKDLNTLELIPDLIQSGIHSFKIEGRLKRPEYTAIVTHIYRKYIDLYLNDPENFAVSQEDQDKLHQIFNRDGFTTGYYEGKQGKDLMSMTRPKNWGLKIGNVVYYDRRNKICEIALDKELKNGDGIEIWTQKGPHATGNIAIISQNNNRVKVKIEGFISPGDAVYRTSDLALLAEIQSTYKSAKPARRVEIFASVTVKLNQPLEIVIWDGEGNVIHQVSDVSPEPSRNSAISEEKIKQQVSKLGNTPFVCNTIEVIMDENVSISVSKLNELRRNSVEALMEQRRLSFKRNGIVKVEEVEGWKEKKGKSNQPKFSVYCKNILLLSSILESGVERVYVDFDEWTLEEDQKSLIEEAKEREIEIVLVLPRISRRGEMRRLSKALHELEKQDFYGYLLGNLGQYSLIRNTKKKKFADFSFNVMNSRSVQSLVELGFDGVTLSPELTLQEIKEVAQNSAVETEILVYGYLPLMETEYCVLGSTQGQIGSQKGCNQQCKDRTLYGLMDRKGMTFPVISNGKSCSSVILNSQPLFVLDQLKEIQNTGCNLRMFFTLERKKETTEMIHAYRAALLDKDRKPFDRLVQHMQQSGYTKGHFYRGVE